MVSIVEAFRLGYRKQINDGRGLALPSSPRPSLLRLPNSRMPDVSSVGSGLGNSIVGGVLTSMARAYSEPTLRTWVREEGEPVEVENDRAALLVENPSPWLDPELLWWYEFMAIVSAGGAYYYKQRSAAGIPVRLLPIYPTLIEPVAADELTGQEADELEVEAGDPHAAWRYSPPGFRSELIRRDDIVYRRWGLDPDDYRRGWCPLKPVLVEILGDQEATRFSTALLHNLGVPGVIMTPRDPLDPGPTPEQADVIKDEYKAKFGGSKTGEPMVITGGAMNVQVISFSPSQMDLTALHRLPEERVSAAIGWPAILANLGAGLDRATYSNAGELREFATEQTLVPLWRGSGRQWTRQLLREFTPGPEYMDFDLTEVRALSEDEDALTERWAGRVQAGIATVGEARRALGMEAEDHHDVFLRSPALIEVPNSPVEEEPEDDLPTADELAERLALASQNGG